MRSRRAFLICAIALVVVALGAAAPWAVSSDRLRQSVARQLAAGFGLQLTVHGRSTVALLPSPRVKFSDITLAASDGRVLAAGGQLRGELRLVPLLAGRLELSGLALANAKLAVDIDDTGANAWAPFLDKLRERAKGEARIGPHVRRLIVTSSDLTYRNRRTGTDEVLGDINIVANWPDREDDAGVAGSLTWRGELIDLSATGFNPAALLAGRASPFSVVAKSARGRLGIIGEGIVEPEVRASGVATFDTASLRDWLGWSGVEIPLGNLLQAFAFDGRFTAGAAEVSFPAIRLWMDRDRFDGAVTVQFGGEKPAVRATLAGQSLDLSAVGRLAADLRTPDGLWVTDFFPARLTGGGSMDLRLSAQVARLGAAKVDDLAAALIVTPGRLELSIGRTGLSDGWVKGKLALASASGTLDLKAQGSFEEIDLSAFLSGTGQGRWLSGIAGGTFLVEGTGESPADLVRQLSGRVGVSARPVEVSGVSLDGVLRRADRRPLSMPLAWRGGRTAFDQGYVNLALANGAAEVTDGALSSSSLRTLLRGRLSLLDRTIALRAVTETGASGPAMPPVVFDIVGPWEDFSVRPNVDALIHRSGAAKPLLAR